LIHPVTRNSGRQRRYSKADVEWVKFLLRLRETGMPIAQMREYAQLRARGASTIEARLALLEAHQAALREQIVQLRAHEKALDTKIATYRDDLAALRANEQNQQGEADE
jgi:DNA-binding transcriptional MerR regulator